ncbi:MAG TPA: MFS transporter [Streptosporangiaceae bacterium]|jgi:putative MFS transporter|nr:MFS transporter [Streptosporangiaceae bacterium]
MTSAAPDTVIEHFDEVMTPTRRRALITIALGEFVDGYDLIVIGGVLLALKPQWHLTTGQAGLLSAITFFGSAAGAVVFGDLTDRVGRRRIFVMNLIAFVGLTLLSAVVPDYPLLLVIRALIGVAIGADIAASMSFLAELSPRASRGGWTGAFPQIAWTIGAMTSVLIDTALLAWGGPGGWRWMLALGAVPAVVVLLLRRSLPDSPRWLLSQGRDREALAAFSDLGIPGELRAAERLPYRQSLRAFGEVFRAPWTAAAIFAVLVTGLSAYVGGASSVLGPYVFEQIGHLSIVLSELTGAVIWAGGIAGSVTAFFVLDRISRVASLIIALVGVFAAYLLMITVAWGTSWLVPLYFVQGFFTWFGASVEWILAAELLPTRLRGRSLGLAHGFSRANIGVSAWIVPPLLASLGFRPLVMIFGAIGLALSAYSLTARRIDATGRSVDETSHDTELQQVRTASSSGGPGYSPVPLPRQ